MRKNLSLLLMLGVLILSACSYTAERNLGTRKDFLRDEVQSTHKETELHLEIQEKPSINNPALSGVIKGAEFEYEDFLRIYQEVENVNFASSTISPGMNILIWTLGLVVAAPLWAYPTWHEEMEREAKYHVGFRPGDYKSSSGDGPTIYTTVYTKERPGKVVKDDKTSKRKSASVKPRMFPAPDSEITLQSSSYQDLSAKADIEISGAFKIDVRSLLKSIFDRQGGIPQGTSLLLKANSNKYGKVSQNLNLTEQEFVEAVAGVNWSPGSPEGIPYPVARIDLLSPGTINAGDNFSIRLTIDNTRGKGDLFKLYAVTSCQNEPYANSRYILLGNIKAGESRSVEATLKTSEELFDKKILLTLTFKELNDYIPQDQALEINVKAVPHASFTITHQIFDGQGDRGVGNKNGILEKGEGPEFEIAIRNDGNAPSGNATIEVLNLPNNDPDLKILGSLTKEIGTLGIGEVTTHKFDMSVKRNFKSENIKFTVKVKENKFNIEKSEDFELVIGKETERKIIEINRPVVVTEEKASLYAGASKQTDTLGYLPQGSKIVAKAWIGDFYQVNLGEGKIAWVETSKVKEWTKSDEASANNVPPPQVVFESDNVPMIAVTSPQSGHITESRKVKIEGFARDDKGLKMLEIKINGNKFKDSGIGGSRANFSEEIELQDGLNKIEVVVEDIKGQKDKMNIEISYFGKYPILKGFYSNVWAVIIGVDKFKDSSVPTLKYAVKDAKGIEELVKGNLVSGRVLTLYNEEATKENILKVLQGELSEAKKDDAIFVYIALHGKTFQTERGTLGDLVPYDGSFNERERYKNISMQIFKDDLARQISAKHLLVVVDACYGGVLTRGVGLKAEKTDTLKEDSYLKDIKDKEAKMVITAGSDNEEVLDKGAGDHSVFTGRFIEAVEKSPHFISAKDLFSQVSLRVHEDAAKRNHKQTPQFGYWWGEGDFIFIKK